jgi:hypothetical protein
MGPRTSLNILERKSLTSTEIQTPYYPPRNIAPIPITKDFLNMTFNPAVQRMDCEISCFPKIMSVGAHCDYSCCFH